MKRERSKGSQDQFKTPAPKKVYTSRAELIAAGLCTVCQAGPFSYAEWPLCPRCMSAFGGADAKAYKGMRQEMKLV